ncbi:hypothetical protein JOD43_000190 [Pullulanibacillus pueri]|uniref:Uncharacterized protein n=1 Tax=Pullulanibacillus pueri TaxID=1437324 RepID=A0A8J2ZSJ8_9BACL|nr:hypothetical protein [Pullulanibacillus pueri]MBM7680031.1 hypothetical protein [Pullulanibacillus pueri]GGH74022.1 hypothetical protein GCM10007096_01850 [Pullulanibacillus pueri]
MDAWWHLFKKEFRLGMPAMLFTIIAFVVIVGLAGYFGIKHGQGTEPAIIAALILIPIHVFYLICYMFDSLQKERKKLHLWLHNPLPGYSLLLAKLVSGLMAMTITLFLCCVVVFIGLNFQNDFREIFDVFTWPNIISTGLFSLINIYLLALDFCIWFIFLWVIYRMLSRRLGGLISFIISLALFCLLVYLENLLAKTHVYDVLTHWGRISIVDIVSGFNFNFSLDPGSHIPADTTAFYLGSYVFEAIIVIILFLISSWILDKKIEV